MDEKHRDLILHRRVRRVAVEHSCMIDDVNTVPDHHPIEKTRDQYLKRALALELLHLDELEEAFRDKALVDRDVANGVFLVQDRRAPRAPLGHAVSVVQHPPEHRETSTDKIERALAT